MFIKVEVSEKDISYINPSYLVEVNAFENDAKKGRVYILMEGGHTLDLRFDNFFDAESYAQGIVSHLN